MEVENIGLNKLVTERQISYDLNHMWNLRKTNRQTKNKSDSLSHTESSS